VIRESSDVKREWQAQFLLSAHDSRLTIHDWQIEITLRHLQPKENFIKNIQNN